MLHINKENLDPIACLVVKGIVAFPPPGGLSITSRIAVYEPRSLDMLLMGL